jgi:hypothetical protein
MTWRSTINRFVGPASSCLLPMALMLWSSEAAAQEGRPCERFDSITVAAFRSALGTVRDSFPSAAVQDRVDRTFVAFDNGLGSRIQTGDVYGALVACFARDIPESSFARSNSSASTNPAATGLLERSGITDLIAIALDNFDFAGANEDAVTVSLNALALRAGGSDGVYSNPLEFQRHDFLRRLGGSFSFGARVPKAEITGFAGFPDANQLFDAVGWDIRIRIFGDRDPRARKWKELLEGVAVWTNRAALITGETTRQMLQGGNAGIDGAFGGAIIAEVNRRGTDTLQNAQRRLQNSWQVTLKAAGQHIAEMQDASRYSVTLLADRGVGSGLDLTLNATYARSSEGPLEAAASGSLSLPVSGVSAQQDSIRIKRVENLEVNLGLTGTILDGALAPDRGVEISLTGRMAAPLAETLVRVMPDGSETAMAVDRESVYKASLSLKLPLFDSGSIPISVIYTNNRDSLIDQNVVEGRLGVSWDFGAITNALKGLAGS